jgi:predicted Zn finger-like uncharacterized protein
MTHRATCLECGTAFTLTDEQLGKSIRCSKCQRLFKISALRSNDEARPQLERPTRSVPVGMLLAAALLLGLATAGGVAYWYGNPVAPPVVVEVWPTQQVAASEGPGLQKRPDSPLLAERHDFEPAPDDPAPQKQPVPKLPPPDGGPPVPRRLANLETHGLGDRALALPSIAGWVMLPDGITLIVALPDQAQLAYIDTVANRELKRVALPFKPDRLAVQGKHLFASAQGTSVVHALDLDSGADKRQIKLPGGFVVDMVCHLQKGLVYASMSSQGKILAIDPDAGSAALTGEDHSPLLGSVVLPPGYRLPASGLPPRVGTGRFLAVDPKNASTLYASYLNAGEKWHEGRRETWWSYLGLKKFTVKGRMEVNPRNMWQRGNSSILPAGRFWPLEVIRINAKVTPSGSFYPLSFSSDGKNIGVTDGHQWELLSTADLESRTGTVACSGAADLAFHPVLELVAVEGDNGGADRGTALYLFNTRSLTQIAKITLSPGPFAKTPPSCRLLSFGARGTKLLYYDWLRAGYLCSFPLTLTASEVEALAKAYHAEVRPFQLPGAIEGESLKILASSGDFSFTPQDMTSFLASGGRWSGGSQLFARGVKAGAWADLELPAPAAGKYHIVAYLTRSWDYGVVQFYLNGRKVGTPIDGFHADTVVSTGPIDLGEAELKNGANKLRVEVVGTNPKSASPHYSWGLDCVVLHHAK